MDGLCRWKKNHHLWIQTAKMTRKGDVTMKVSRRGKISCAVSLVLSSIYQLDIHLHQHAVVDRQYTDSDRLVAVEKNLKKS